MRRGGLRRILRRYRSIGRGGASSQNSERHSMSLMPCFKPGQAFDEGTILGRLLTGYGELEVGMCSCLIAVEGMFDRPIRTIFRSRGAESRIKIAEGALKSDFTRSVQFMSRASSATSAYPSTTDVERHCPVSLSANNRHSQIQQTKRPTCFQDGACRMSERTWSSNPRPPLSVILGYN
jgi:hypothetical protein